MNLHSEHRRPRQSTCGFVEEDRDTQVQHVLRILQDSWGQLASDLEMLEAGWPRAIPGSTGRASSL
jgi:hypothetical protein